MAQPREELLVLLALVLGRWALAEPQCHHGEVRTAWGGDTKCCPKCHWEPGSVSPCQASRDPDCQCPQGHSCATQPCLYCQPLPRCARGNEPARTGQVNFQFGCKPCKPGMYSSGGNGWCRNWTDCESIGLQTLRPGNSSHDSECGSPGRPLETAGISLDFGSSTILAILTAVAVVVLILLTFLLHFCVWTFRRDRKFPPADLGSNLPRLAPLAMHGEESPSIQFPEEEHGDKTAEEKLSILSLTVCSESR